MKLRCDIHLGDQSSKLLLYPRPDEKLDHLALKLAAYTMFYSLNSILELSANHASLMGFDHKPDVMALDNSGEIRLWVECGAVTTRKLDKVMRRMPGARMVVLKSTERDAQRLRMSLEKDVRHGSRIEIWTWPDSGFNEWKSSLAEKVEIFGDAHEKSFNLVVNEMPYAVDLIGV